MAIGAATDPYQPAEGRYRLTRGCIEALAEARTPLTVITRGPLIVRDVDVLAEASAARSRHGQRQRRDDGRRRWPPGSSRASPRPASGCAPSGS